MRQYLLLAASLLTITACTNSEKQSTANQLPAGKLTINGRIKGADSSIDKVIIYRDELTTMLKDTAEVKDGAFVFNTDLKEPQRMILELDGSPDRLIFFADPGTVTIEATIDSFSKANVKAGNSQKEFRKVMDELDAIFKKADPYYEPFEAAKASGNEQEITRIRAIFNKLQQEVDDLFRNYALNNKNSIVAATFLSMNMRGKEEYEPFRQQYDGFTDAVKNSIPGKQSRMLLDSKKNTEVGGTAADFTLNDVSGKPVSLSSFKGKYVLMDFWASWCMPCRMENPNVVKAYNAYKSKGFDVLGVSLDDSKADWLAAIEKDGLSWTQVSDLQGQGDWVSLIYRIKQIPSNFLLDKEGKIIAKDLRGDALEQKLAEVLQ